MKLRDAGRGWGSLSRTLALVAVAVLVLHELRCLLGALGAGEAVRLGAVVPLIACAGLLVLAARLLRARLGGRAPAASSIATLPLARQLAVFAAAIVGLYLAGALAEGVLLAGGLGGLGLLAPGGLCVLPLAFALAPICLLADRCFGRLEELAAVAGAQPERPSSPLQLGLPLASWPTCAGLSPLALGLARRGPPLSFG
ncbi:MAG: hypothetical protein R2725_07035 [Solirubrobacterales bacterium]